jgi:hypothetical protein
MGSLEYGETFKREVKEVRSIQRTIFRINPPTSSQNSHFSVSPVPPGTPGTCLCNLRGLPEPENGF